MGDFFFHFHSFRVIISKVGAVAQLVEQRPEEPCVTGSSPVGATKFYITRHFRRFFSSNYLLSTSENLVCYFVPILHEKYDKNCRSAPINSSVNTLNNQV